MRYVFFTFIVFGTSFLGACTSAQSSSGAGTTTARVTTDARGQIVTVAITKSAGSAMLDRATVDFIKKNWHGPPNSSKEVTFKYQVHPKA